jgi:phosphatidylglycerophosphate synthase
MEKFITPNRVTAVRVAMAIAAAALYAMAPRTFAFQIGIAGVSLTLLAVILDGLDGFLARHFHLASAVGAKLDILGDRVLENLFFTFFAVAGEISVWVPVLFFVRGAITDFLRGLAAARVGGLPRHEFEFRRSWFLESRFGKAIVASRASRVAYGAVKCASFCALGIEWMLRHVQTASSARAIHFVGAANVVLVSAAIAFCILRAVPVFWEGRSYFARESHPIDDSAHVSNTPVPLRTFRRSAHQAVAR